VQLEDEFVPAKEPVKKTAAEKKRKAAPSAKGSSKKVKGLKKDGTPKAARGKSSFMFFSSEVRPKVKEANPDMAFGDLSKVALP
jgi:hypothetical protein